MPIEGFPAITKTQKDKYPDFALSCASYYGLSQRDEWRPNWHVDLLITHLIARKKLIDDFHVFKR